MKSSASASNSRFTMCSVARIRPLQGRHAPQLLSCMRFAHACFSTWHASKHQYVSCWRLRMPRWSHRGRLQLIQANAVNHRGSGSCLRMLFSMLPIMPKSM